MKPYTQPPSLIEELIAEKQGLGAKYILEPNTLEVKPNQNGISGILLDNHFLRVPR